MSGPSNPCWTTIGPMWVPCHIYQIHIEPMWVPCHVYPVHVGLLLGQYGFHITSTKSMLGNHWADVGTMSGLSIHVGQPLGQCGYHIRSINPCWATIGLMWVPCQVYQSMLGNHWADVGTMSGLAIHVGQPLGRCGYHVRSINPCWATIGPMWVPCQV